MGNKLCGRCVYFPPNLPEQAYSAEDYQMLMSKACSFDATPGDETCDTMRKGSCGLVSLDKLFSQEYK
jgi:hypothetical protein